MQNPIVHIELNLYRSEYAGLNDFDVNRVDSISLNLFQK